MAKSLLQSMSQHLTQGLIRLAYAIKSEAWVQADRRGFSGTQARIIDLLATRGSQSLNEIAAFLSVTAATASDSVTSLEEKGLLTKEAAKADARRKVITLTALGRKEARGHAEWSNFLLKAITTLSLTDQAQLLRMISQIILNLQLDGLIPAPRMCVSCQFFRPNQHPGQDKVHHCAFVNAPIGDADLRMDCAEHKVGDLLSSCTSRRRRGRWRGTH